MLFKRKQPPTPTPQPSPTVIVQVAPPAPTPVQVKEHTRHLPFIERPKDADARRVIREAKLRKKLERKGLLPRDETEIEKMAREAEDLSNVLSASRKKEKEFDEK